MRALVWITEESWDAVTAWADAELPRDAEVTLLCVVSTEAEGLVRGPRAGLLGRGPKPPDDDLRPVSEAAAEELLNEAAASMRRSVQLQRRRGRVEHEVLAAAERCDLLVLARNGENRPGPHSIRHQSRFVVDHAPCALMLVWPGTRPRSAS